MLRRQMLATAPAMMATLLTGNAMFASSAMAQSKISRIVVPYGPGGPIDVTARVLAERVKDSLGTVIVENKPGAGGNIIGVDLVAKATPDGLTIGIAAVATHAINPWLFTKMPLRCSKGQVLN